MSTSANAVASTPCLISVKILVLGAAPDRAELVERLCGTGTLLEYSADPLVFNGTGLVPASSLPKPAAPAVVEPAPAPAPVPVEDPKPKTVQQKRAGRRPSRKAAAEETASANASASAEAKSTEPAAPAADSTKAASGDESSF